MAHLPDEFESWCREYIHHSEVIKDIGKDILATYQRGPENATPDEYRVWQDKHESDVQRRGTLCQLREEQETMRAQVKVKIQGALSDSGSVVVDGWVFLNATECKMFVACPVAQGGK
jgi:CTP-dependent riboflavin kinase